MKILPYQIDTTNDFLISRVGLLSIAELMNSLKLAERIDACFPPPGSNRGFMPSVFMETLILMQHEGGFHLDDVRYIQEDTALRTLLGLEKIPQADSLGNWLRRMGKHPQCATALKSVNQSVLKSTLHHCKAITLDIDATEVIAGKAETHWTYKNNRGYMPMVGHIAQTGQVVACDFRPGNTPPAQSRRGCDIRPSYVSGLSDNSFLKNAIPCFHLFMMKILQHVGINFEFFHNNSSKWG